jgi:hypothetical protein
MAEQERRVRCPDGVSVSTPALGLIPGLGRTYYSNPGSPTAPQVTWTLRRGLGGGGFHAVFLGNGMTSEDTLGSGATANMGFGVNTNLNASIPDLRQPWNMKVSSVEGGLGLPGFAVTQTYTPQQIADWMISRGMGPQDELTPFERSLQSKNASIGPNAEPAVPFLNRKDQNPLGGGMGNWSASTARSSAFETGASPARYLSSSPQESVGGTPGSTAGATGSDLASPTLPAGGLLGLIQDYMRLNPDGGAAR